jgi:hypothetical protein
VETEWKRCSADRLFCHLSTSFPNNSSRYALTLQRVFIWSDPLGLDRNLFRLHHILSIISVFLVSELSSVTCCSFFSPPLHQSIIYFRQDTISFNSTSSGLKFLFSWIYFFLVYNFDSFMWIWISVSLIKGNKVRLRVSKTFYWGRSRHERERNNKSLVKITYWGASWLFLVSDIRFILLSLPLAQQPNAGQGRLILEISRTTHNNTSQSVRLLWTSDRPDAEISTWPHATLPRKRHTCSRRDPNPQSQQQIGHGPSP